MNPNSKQNVGPLTHTHRFTAKTRESRGKPYPNSGAHGAQQAGDLPGGTHLQEQFDVLVNKNPDLNYVTEMLLAAIRNHGVDPDRVFVFGSGMGGDLAYRLACEKADVLTAVILHDASPFPEERSYCQPKRPIHVLVWQQSGSEPARDRMLKFWEKENTCEPGEKLSHTLQVTLACEILLFARRRYDSFLPSTFEIGRDTRLCGFMRTSTNWKERVG